MEQEEITWRMVAGGVHGRSRKPISELEELPRAVAHGSPFAIIHLWPTKWCVTCPRLPRHEQAQRSDAMPRSSACTWLTAGHGFIAKGHKVLLLVRLRAIFIDYNDNQRKISPFYSFFYTYLHDFQH